MGKASRTKQAPDRRARIAAQQAAQRRAEQRRRIYWAGGSVLVVAIVVVALVIVKLNTGKSSGPAAPTGTALSKVVSQVTGVPTATTDKIGGGDIPASVFIPGSGIASAASSGQSYFATVNGDSLTSDGKPEVLYLGAEYCPFCAAQRWSMINSLSRFGTFSDLKAGNSSSSDTFPSTPTFTFYGSKYTSKYVSFVPVEETTEDSSVTLQTPTTAQKQIGQTYDPTGSIPFFDIANKYVQVGNLTPYSPGDLQGKTWAEIGTALNDPTTTISKNAIANANYMTAAICQVTNNQPASACTPAIQKLESSFAAAS